MIVSFLLCLEIHLSFNGSCVNDCSCVNNWWSNNKKVKAKPKQILSYYEIENKDFMFDFFSTWYSFTCFRWCSALKSHIRSFFRHCLSVNHASWSNGKTSRPKFAVLFSHCIFSIIEKQSFFCWLSSQFVSVNYLEIL